ncbi:hypothetical protein HDV57DRAFT_515436 [Trichoderma longibrachiatum]|uniref:HNH nuclease domain-containing protein n=1 Tax=Trichoderma longibrachiatum ATCC 18648 TaxID=983965 RepID=A0A2T4C4B3_TRILO|nr:hypothetical protein M440DRAFT_4882 [Trichoderma longibrachiatum ATCC 18648]
MYPESPPRLNPLLPVFVPNPPVEIEIIPLSSSPTLGPEHVEYITAEDIIFTIETSPEPRPPSSLDDSVEILFAEATEHAALQRNPFHGLENGAELEAAIRSFLHRPSTTTNTLLQLMDFLAEDPAYWPPSDLIPRAFLSDKITFIQNILGDLSEEFGEQEFNTLQFVYFCMMETHRVHLISTEDWEQNEYFMDMTAELPRSLFRYVDVADPSRLAQNPVEQDIALARDGNVCILTGAADPKACRILPFATTANQYNAQSSWAFWYTMNDFLDEESRAGFNSLLLTAGASDKAWNMLSMTLAMGALWKKGHFAFRCVRITPVDGDRAVIRLQFHWMPRNDVDPKAVATLTEENILRLLQDTSGLDGPGGADARRTTGRRVENGHTFGLRMTMAEAVRMKVAVDIQWAAIRLAAISGLARSWDAGNGDVDLESFYADNIPFAG